MGNAASCAPSIICSGVVKVMIFSDGRLEIYTRPMRVGELMVENPGQFVCDSTHLRVGHRIPGLSADDELQRRKLYFLLPMEMLYSVLTNEELSCVTHKASKALKNGRLNFAKIFPIIGDFSCMFPSDVKTSDSSSSTSEPLKRYLRQRSWAPALETIAESSPLTKK